MSQALDLGWTRPQAGDRFVRICPFDDADVFASYKAGLRYERMICDHRHELDAWLILDADSTAIVGVGVVNGYGVLAFSRDERREAVAGCAAELAKRPPCDCKNRSGLPCALCADYRRAKLVWDLLPHVGRLVHMRGVA